MIKLVCKTCGKEFSRFSCHIKRGQGKYCSRKCMGKAYSKLNKGKNSHYWKGGEILLNCQFCRKQIYRKCSHLKRSRYLFCSAKCYHSWCSEENNYMYGRIKEKNPCWKGGKSFEPHTPEFNKKLKEKIRKRDNYQCQFSGTTQNKREFPVHHINYDKSDCRPKNLITLCDSIHLNTNFNREKWQFFFEIYQEIRMV